MNNLCCPHCGNPDLQVTNEVNTQTTGSGYSVGQGCLGYLLFGPLGLLCGGCGSGQKTTTTNTTFWVCSKCGHKFQNPDDIRKTAETQRTSAMTCAVVLPLALTVLCIILSVIADGLPSGLWAVIVIVDVIGIIMGAVIGSGVKKRLAEADDIEASMRKFQTAKKTPAKQQPAQKTINNVSEWKCQCGAQNIASSVYCGTCGKHKPECNSENVSDEWQCEKCGSLNQNNVTVCECGEQRPS